MEAGIRDALQKGYPPLGWEGDDRLEVYLGPENRLYVWRLEDDGEYRLVSRSAPGIALDIRLIQHLVDHDTHRGYDPASAISRHNDRLHTAQDSLGDELLREAKKRAYYAAGRDIGHLF